MDFEDLLYNEIVVDNAKTAQMLDLLLRRVFEKDMYFGLRNKESTMVTFKFWSTKEEYDYIISTMDKELNYWDKEYEKLLG